MSSDVTSIVVVGLGGQGVLTATDILAEAAFLAGLDVKKSEIHGMSQRGGSVVGDVRFGREVFSPTVPPGEADCLLALAAEEAPACQRLLRPGAAVVLPDRIPPGALADRRSLNVAMLGVLSASLPIAHEHWQAAIRKHLAPKLHEANLEAFEVGRAAATSK